MNTEKDVWQIKKEISSIEWDMPNMTNQELKRTKETRLLQLKKQLNNLLSKAK